MPAALEEFLITGVFAFILTFVRIGSAIMIMPGVGDSFAPARVRLHFALGVTLVMFPLVMPNLPYPLPNTFALASLIVMEFIIGIFFGTLARIFMAALDTAGMVISTQSGLANAQIFNPSLATQGSIIGAFLSVTGVVFLFSVDMHHYLIMGLLETYEMFEVGAIPDTGSMAEVISKALAKSFSIGVKLAAPFLIITLLIYVGMGVLSRLMPQVQVFLLALPLQILISLMSLTMIVSAGLLYWITEYEKSMTFFFLQGSP